MPLQDDYHVTLDAFKGPLDLLLFLIRRAEVEITDIRIVEITDQYLALLSQIESIDIDLAGEFLVTAATLVEIKSRVLQRAQEGSGSDADGSESLDLDESDPRYELVQQLLAYQKYRVAAETLQQRREEFAQRFAVRPTRPVNELNGGDAPTAAELDLDDAHVFDLFEAYERIIDSIDFSRMGAHEIEDTDTPVGLHQEDLLDRLKRSEDRRVSLQRAWQGRTRADVIGLFLATLELVRRRRITVVQDDPDSEIMLALNDDPEEWVDDPEQAESEG